MSALRSASSAFTLNTSALCFLISSSDDAESSSLSFFELRFCGMLCTPRFKGWPCIWPPKECPFTLLWFSDELGFRPTGSIVPSDARFCGKGRPMYCDRSACNGGNLGALGGQGDGKTGGMNQGNAPVGGPEESEPGTPLAVCNSRAWRDNSLTPVNRIPKGLLTSFMLLQILFRTKLNRLFVSEYIQFILF